MTREFTDQRMIEHTGPRTFDQGMALLRREIFLGTALFQDADQVGMHYSKVYVPGEYVGASLKIELNVWRYSIRR